MALSEFGLIARYFSDCGARRPDVRLGVGDDAALLASPPGHDLVAAIDTLVEGVHFPQQSPPASIGHRALAVNLSDVAAMGARPAWALLALTLPAAREDWLAGFAEGLGRVARTHGVQLVGGDTTSGPLCISVQILGTVPTGTALTRSGARPGDRLFVSGTPGDAAAGLLVEQARLTPRPEAAAWLRERFLFPTPRLALGERLRGLASACIDVSDGLLGDAAKLAQASGCGAQLIFEDIPVSAALVQAVGAERARELALTGGDDYELCFAVSAERVPELEGRLPAGEWDYRLIGVLTEGEDVHVTRGGARLSLQHGGYDHFART
jgi:thiamine-monophosphate kinase